MNRKKFEILSNKKDCNVDMLMTVYSMIQYNVDVANLPLTLENYNNYAQILYDADFIFWDESSTLTVKDEKKIKIEDSWDKVKDILNTKKINGMNISEYNKYIKRGQNFITGSTSCKKQITKLLKEGYSIELIADVIIYYYSTAESKFSKTIGNFLEEEFQAAYEALLYFKDNSTNDTVL